MDDLFLGLDAVESVLLLVVFGDLHGERRMNIVLSLHELIDFLLVQVQEMKELARQKALPSLIFGASGALSDLVRLCNVWHSRVALSAELDLRGVFVLTQAVAQLAACLLPNLVALARGGEELLLQRLVAVLVTAESSHAADPIIATLHRWSVLAGAAMPERPRRIGVFERHVYPVLGRGGDVFRRVKELF